ncbi:ABC transporter permease subunit [Amphritea sp. 1_MG-2023]|uniref:ABC transporter permease subunit n=1 Tax=Amphritea sp. 1_MG-2023 TaxID=3062670 RepID=UPI0026E41B7D|nr:ABC transporter permease subunit [Amphritea sp. 1_MG-2023]MDO6563397.1 ABC transporter permease subunit [Amphritea sp. 1_MG-2023]
MGIPEKQDHFRTANKSRISTLVRNILPAKKADEIGKKTILAVPYLWLSVFFLVPFFIIFQISFTEAIIARPPYTSLVEIEEGLIQIRLVTESYLMLFEDDIYWKSYLNSAWIAATSTLICFLIGYPMAYGIARAPAHTRRRLLLFIILPFWTAFILRVYAWVGILNNNGILNNILQWLGLTDTPIQFLYTDFAIYIGIVYTYLPFMILPIYTTLEKMDLSLMEASSDLGGRPVTTFMRITLPLSVPGIIAGSMLVFIPALGEFVIPALLGGDDSLMIGRVLFDEFFLNRDWPMASTVAVAMLIFLVAPIVLFNHFQSKEMEAK